MRNFLIVLSTIALSMPASATLFVGNPTAGNGWDTTSEVSVRGSNEKPGREWIHTINGDGMVGVNGKFHTDCLEDDCIADGSTFATMGFNQGPQGPDRWAGGTPSRYWTEFGFTSAQDVTDVHIWNYNEDTSPEDGPDGSGQWSMQGMKEITVMYTTIGNGGGWGSDTEGDWTTLGTFVLNRGSGDDRLPAELIALNDSAQYVIFLGANSPEGNFMGPSDFNITSASPEGALSEVRFAVVPEPATWALLGLGGLVLYLRRRR